MESKLSTEQLLEIFKIIFTTKKINNHLKCSRTALERAIVLNRSLGHFLISVKKPKNIKVITALLLSIK